MTAQRGRLIGKWLGEEEKRLLDSKAVQQAKVPCLMTRVDDPHDRRELTPEAALCVCAYVRACTCVCACVRVPACV